MYKLQITTDREIPFYRCGEEIIFHLTAWQDGKLLNGGSAVWQLYPGDTRRRASGTVVWDKENPARIRCRPERPGICFLQVGALRLNGAEVPWDGALPVCAAAAEPDAIRSEAVAPADFDAFWRHKIAEISPGAVSRTPRPECSTPELSASTLTVKLPDHGCVDGILSVPVRGGRYPAIIGIPGAGPGNTTGGILYDLEVPHIRLMMNVHRFPTARNAGEQTLRYERYNAALPEKIYSLSHADDRERYHFASVWAAISRAVDFTAALPEFDGEHFFAAGNSQGGGTALAVAALNHHITALASGEPAFAGHGFWRESRRDCWPFLHENRGSGSDAAAPYFDLLFFAERVKIPSLLGAGFLDTTCPAEGIYAAFARLRGPRRMVPMIHSGHTTCSPFAAAVRDFFQKELHSHSNQEV